MLPYSQYYMNSRIDLTQVPSLSYESSFSIQSFLGPGVQPPEEVLPNLPGFGLSSVLVGDLEAFKHYLFYCSGI